MTPVAPAAQPRMSAGPKHSALCWISLPCVPRDLPLLVETLKGQMGLRLLPHPARRAGLPACLQRSGKNSIHNTKYIHTYICTYYFVPHWGPQSSLCPDPRLASRKQGPET